MGTINNIDEIGIFPNNDGSYSAELYITTTEGNRMTIKIPRSSLDINLINGGYNGMSIELKLEGMVSLL